VPSLGGTSEELFALANAVAAVIGGSVAIEDLDHRVLAYSSIPGQRIDDLRRRGILERRVPRAALRGDQTAGDPRFHLGLPERPQLMLLGFAPAAYGTDRTGPAVVRLGAAAARHWAAVHNEAAVATVGRTVYTLLPQARPAEALALSTTNTSPSCTSSASLNRAP
jgi:hypothetical protein